MSISKDEVRYLATLARLNFTDEEEIQLALQMDAILGYMEKLNEVDTSTVPPLSHVLDDLNVFRSDEAYQRISHDEALKNAPESDSDYFRVPKVIS